MPDTDRDYELIEFFKNTLPQVYREHMEHGRQSVQFVAWLVGFSVAMGALVLTGLEKMAYLGAEVFATIVGLLTFAILAGILHRIAYHYLEGRIFLLMQRLQGQLGGFLVGARGTVTDPSEVLRTLASLVGPFMGLSEEEALRRFMKGDSDRTRREVQAAGRINQLADWLYYLTSAAFMLAIVILAWNLLRHAFVKSG